MLGSGLNTTGTGTGEAAGSSGTTSDTTSGTTSGTSTTASFDGGPPLHSGPIGEETECNGVDDDGNGIIDDVDLDGDGVCDCLKIATIGTSAIVGPGDVFSTWLSERGPEPAVSLSAESFFSRQQVTAEALAGYQVLVVQNISKGTPYSPAEIDAIEAWVRNGGGLIALLGYGGAVAEQTNMNAVLEPLGVRFGSQSVLFGGLAGTLPIETWYDHPVSEGLERVGFNNGNEALGAGTVVAERDGITALRAHQVDQGRVLLWGDEWVTINSEWESQPTFDTERFWLNVLKWLSPPTECQVPVVLI